MIDTKCFSSPPRWIVILSYLSLAPLFGTKRILVSIIFWFLPLCSLLILSVEEFWNNSYYSRYVRGLVIIGFLMKYVLYSNRERVKCLSIYYETYHAKLSSSKKSHASDSIFLLVGIFGLGFKGYGLINHLFISKNGTYDSLIFDLAKFQFKWVLVFADLLTLWFLLCISKQLRLFNSTILRFTCLNRFDFRYISKRYLATVNSIEYFDGVFSGVMLVSIAGHFLLLLSIFYSHLASTDYNQKVEYMTFLYLAWTLSNLTLKCFGGHYIHSLSRVVPNRMLMNASHYNDQQLSTLMNIKTTNYGAQLTLWGIMKLNMNTLFTVLSVAFTYSFMLQQIYKG